MWVRPTIGVAACRSGEAVEAAIHRADQAMYAEKVRYYQDKNIDRRHLGKDASLSGG